MGEYILQMLGLGKYVDPPPVTRTPEYDAIVDIMSRPEEWEHANCNAKRHLKTGLVVYLDHPIELYIHGHRVNHKFTPEQRSDLANKFNTLAYAMSELRSKAQQADADRVFTEAFGI